MAQPRAAHWVALVAVVLALLLLLALLAEGAVRLRQFTRYGTFGSLAHLYHIDERIGLRVLRPGLRIGAIRINSDGFRGPDIVHPKGERVVRIAFLGASTTFCGEVSSDAAAWPHIVVERLSARFPATRFDFVNGGVPGYTVSSSRLNLRHKVAPLRPDIVVVYHATNDLSGEINALAAKAGLPIGRRDADAGWLERHSLLWELAVKNLRVLLAQREPEPGTQDRLRVSADELGSEFRRELQGLVRESAATGARVAVATFATHLRPGQSAEQQRRAAVSALVYMPSMSLDGLLTGYARYNALIAEVARAEGALLIGGEDRIPGDPAHFVDSVHFSDQGARLMAERVADAVAGDAQVLALIERMKRPG